MDSEASCRRHEGEALIAKCALCGEPICRTCRESFGYFCSEGCRNASRKSVDPKAKQELLESIEKGVRITQIIKRCAAAIMILALACVAWFIWDTFLSSVGTVTWQKKNPFPPGGFNILSNNAEKLILRTGASVSTIDTKTWKIISSSESKALASLHKPLYCGPAGLLFAADRKLIMLSQEGKQLWEAQIPGMLQSATANEYCAIIASVPPRKKEDDEDLDPNKKQEWPRCTLSMFNLQDGKIAWQRQFGEGESVGDITCSGSSLFAYSHSKYGKDDFKCTIKCADLKSGADLWQIKQENMASWGPEFYGDTLIFMDKQHLCAISKDGKNKLWTLPVAYLYGNSENIQMHGDLLLVNDMKSLACIDLKAQKVLWQKAPEIEFDSFVYADGKIFLRGYAESKDGAEIAKNIKLPPAFEQLEDNDPVKQSLNTFKKGVKYENVLLCLEAQSGKELWKVRKVAGQIAAAGKTVVAVSDTAIDSKMSMIGLSSSAKGEMVFKQFNADDGKLLFTKSSPIGLTGPYLIAGGKLIGLEYDREAGVIPHEVFLGRGPAVNYIGLAGVSLK